MFRLSHRDDFDAVLSAREPFALVRYGDGEGAILAGRMHNAPGDGWRVEAGGSPWLREGLLAALTRNAEGFCVGLPSGCCLRDYLGLHAQCGAPKHQRTFATLFLHGNLKRMRDLVARFEPVIVGQLGQIGVPARGAQDGCDLDAVVTQMLAVERTIFVSAGPLANLFIDRYWQRQEPARRQIVLDVGSALDHHITGVPTRYYHHQGRILSHHCELGAAPLVAGTQARSFPQQQRGKTVHANTTRVIIGGPAVRSSRPTAVQTQGQSPGFRRPASNPGPIHPGGATVGAPGMAQKTKCAKCVRLVRSRR